MKVCSRCNKRVAKLNKSEDMFGEVEMLCDACYNSMNTAVAGGATCKKCGKPNTNANNSPLCVACLMSEWVVKTQARVKAINSTNANKELAELNELGVSMIELSDQDFEEWLTINPYGLTEDGVDENGKPKYKYDKYLNNKMNPNLMTSAEKRTGSDTAGSAARRFWIYTKLIASGSYPQNVIEDNYDDIDKLVTANIDQITHGCDSTGSTKDKWCKLVIAYNAEARAVLAKIINQKASASISSAELDEDNMEVYTPSSSSSSSNNSSTVRVIANEGNIYLLACSNLNY